MNFEILFFFNVFIFFFNYNLVSDVILAWCSQISIMALWLEKTCNCVLGHSCWNDTDRIGKNFILASSLHMFTPGSCSLQSRVTPLEQFRVCSSFLKSPAVLFGIYVFSPCRWPATLGVDRDFDLF